MTELDPGRKKLILIVVGVGVLVFIGAFIATFWLGSQKGEEERAISVHNVTQIAPEKVLEECDAFEDFQEALANSQRTCWLLLREVTSVSPDIRVFTQLQHLIITESSVTSLPEEVGQLAALSVLNVAANDQLSTLPESLGSLMNLTFLDVSNTRVKKLPQNLAAMVKLKTIVFSTNQISEAEKTRIRSAIPNVNIVEHSLPPPPSLPGL